MAGCVPCFIIPLVLFIFHRYIQPILLKFWNPWEKNAVQDSKECKFDCDCSWNKKKETEIENKTLLEPDNEENKPKTL